MKPKKLVSRFAIGVLPLLSYYHATKAILTTVKDLGDVPFLPTIPAPPVVKVNEENLSTKSTSSGSITTRTLSSTSTTSFLRDSVKLRWKSLPLNNHNRTIRPLVLQNAIPRQSVSSTLLNKNDIVLASHLSATKFVNLRLQLEYWNGPASVSVYMKSVQDVDAFFDFWDTNQGSLKQIAFHFVLESTTKLPYPYNTLRQVALDGVETDWFLAIDVDLVPLPRNCHSALKLEIDNIDMPSKNRTLFILPAFSVPQQEEGSRTPAPASMLPASKADAVAMTQTGQLKPFHSDFPPAYGPTSYQKWMEQVHSPHQVYPINLNHIEAVNFEPYVVGYKPNIPRYWEELRGFGFDKSSFLFECYAAGYKYAVLNNFFCAHFDHPYPYRSRRREEFAINLQIWKSLLRLLQKRYPLDPKQYQEIWEKFGHKWNRITKSMTRRIRRA
eukprot:scaffold363_cov56-Cylindrotheca_fusiformis.AAC.27